MRKAIISLADIRKPTIIEQNLCRMKVATVFDSSDPLSIILKHNGIISVVSKNVMTSCSSVFTKAPITPKLVKRKYSNGRVLDDV